MTQYYCIDDHHDAVLITTDCWNVNYIALGECKERTLTEFKALAAKYTWIFKAFTDADLIQALKLKTTTKLVLQEVVAYTDGSCYHKTKIGGYGVYLSTVVNGETHEKKISVGYSNTKIGRMEIMGIIAAMDTILPNKRATTKLTIYCDSQYAVNCIAKGWLWRWNLSKDMYKRINGDLYVKMMATHDSFPKGNVVVKWCAGHTKDNLGNIEADRLAGMAAKSGVYIRDICVWNVKDV